MSNTVPAVRDVPGPKTRTCDKPQEKKPTAGNGTETTPSPVLQAHDHPEGVRNSRDASATELPNLFVPASGQDVGRFQTHGGDMEAPTDRSLQIVEESTLHNAEAVVEHQQLTQKVKELQDQKHENEKTLAAQKSTIAAQKSRIAFLEQQLEQRSEGAGMVPRSWETFRSCLTTLLMELGRGQEGLAEAIKEAEDSIQIKEFDEIVHSYLSPDFETCTGDEGEYRQRLQALMRNFMKELDKENVFQMDSSPVRCIMIQLLFFLIANQLYRMDGECEVCPLCGIKKKHRRNNEEEGDPETHIFPESLLDIFSAVHCEQAGNFIWDKSLSRKFGAGKLTVQLLCQKCESSASHAERKLRDLYVHILSQSNKRIAVPNEREWLPFILASIMLRGLVSSVNLVTEFHSRRFETFKALFTLRNFCMEYQAYHVEHRSGKTPQPPVPPLWLYILPNGPFKPEVRDATYIFDLQLRNPQFTSIVEERDGNFLYTKCDCFHWVLPLVDCNMGFDENGLVSGKITILSEEERKRQFPQVLLRRNLDEAVQLAKHIISQPQECQLDRHCKVFIARAPSIRPQYTERPEFKIVQASRILDPYEFNESIRYDKKELKQLIEKATEVSPLRTVQVGDDIHIKEKAKMKKQNRMLQGDSDKMKQELRKTRRELEQKKQQLNEAEKAAERQTRAAEVEKRNFHKLDQKCHDLEAELQKSQKRNQALEQELHQLRPAWFWAEPVQEEAVHAASELVSGAYP